MNKLTIIPIALLTTALLAGCGDHKKQAKLDHYLQTVKKTNPPPKLAPAPKIKITQNTYRASTSRDPFENPHVKQKKKSYPNTYLGKYALDNLKLAGILTREDKTWALVTSPDGKMHKITQGMRIGTNQILITKITHNEVQLLDQSYLNYGQKAKKIVLTLTQPTSKG